MWRSTDRNVPYPIEVNTVLEAHKLPLHLDHAVMNLYSIIVPACWTISTTRFFFFQSVVCQSEMRIKYLSPFATRSSLMFGKIKYDISISYSMSFVEKVYLIYMNDIFKLILLFITFWMSVSLWQCVHSVTWNYQQC